MRQAGDAREIGLAHVEVHEQDAVAGRHELEREVDRRARLAFAAGPARDHRDVRPRAELLDLDLERAVGLAHDARHRGQVAVVEQAVADLGHAREDRQREHGGKRLLVAHPLPEMLHQQGGRAREREARDEREHHDDPRRLAERCVGRHGGL